MIDDPAGSTLAFGLVLCARSSRGPRGQEGRRAQVGRLIAEKARRPRSSEVVFDRNGFNYHGRVAAVAEAAREAGLKF